MTHTKTLLLFALVALFLAPLSCKNGGGGTIRGGGGDASDPGVMFRNGVSVLDAGADKGKTDYQKAMDYFEGACETSMPHDISDDPENPRMSKDKRKPEYFYNAGFVAERLGRGSDAEGYYLDAIDVDSAYTPALVNLAYLYAESERPGKAADIYQQYLEGHPEDVPMMLNLAGALGEAGDMDGAERWIRQVLFEDPENDLAYKVLARAYYQLGQFDMALLLNDMASAIKEEDSEIRNTMGLTYLKMGDDVKASLEFQKAREMDPENLQANLNLGYLALDSGDFRLAAECFNAVLVKYPGSVDSHLGLAVAYRGIADFDSALAEYDAILEFDPANKSALINKARVQDRLLKDFKASRATLTEYEKHHGSTEIIEEIDTVDTHQYDKDEEDRKFAEFERMITEQKAKAEAAAKVLNVKIENAYLLFELYGERADAIDSSFNQALDFYVLQAEDATAVPDDPDYINSCEGYLDTFILDEYLRALEENEKLEDYPGGRNDLWSDPDALKNEKIRREGGGEAAPPDDETAPPDDETAPPDDETAPPDDETAPPDDETAPPDDETAPPDDETGGEAPPDDGGDVPPSEEAPPAGETAPPAEETAPATDETAPPAEGG